MCGIFFAFSYDNYLDSHIMGSVVPVPFDPYEIGHKHRYIVTWQNFNCFPILQISLSHSKRDSDSIVYGIGPPLLLFFITPKQNYTFHISLFCGLIVSSILYFISFIFYRSKTFQQKRDIKFEKRKNTLTRSKT